MQTYMQRQHTHTHTHTAIRTPAQQTYRPTQYMQTHQYKHTYRDTDINTSTHNTYTHTRTHTRHIGEEKTAVQPHHHHYFNHRHHYIHLRADLTRYPGEHENTNDGAERRGGRQMHRWENWDDGSSPGEEADSSAGGRERVSAKQCRTGREQ